MFDVALLLIVLGGLVYVLLIHPLLKELRSEPEDEDLPW